MIISHLAFIPSLREMGAKFGHPHNSLSVVVIRPALDAMCKALFISAETKLIRFPENQDEINLCTERNAVDDCLPCCSGAIDGSLIPGRKPTRAQAKGATDAYYRYKWFISHQLKSKGVNNCLKIGLNVCVGVSRTWRYDPSGDL